MISRILIGILVISLSSCVGVTVTEARNEYLNDGTNTCSTGDLSLSIEQRDSESRYRHYNPDNNYSSPSDDQSLRLTWRKYLGSACTNEFNRFIKKKYSNGSGGCIVDRRNLYWY